MRRLCHLFVALLSAVCLSSPAAAAPADLAGRTLDGTPVNLAGLRGKVVMVVLWSTNCAVCRDVLPELRSNYAGWRGKPFEIVAISLDTRRADVESYGKLLDVAVTRGARFPIVWRGERGHLDTFGTPAQLPAVFVIDAQGKVAEQFTGRVPGEAWDRIADLLP